MKHLHLESTFRTQVSLEHFLEALGGVDVDAQGGGLTHDISISVNELEGGHGVCLSVSFEARSFREEPSL